MQAKHISLDTALRNAAQLIHTGKLAQAEGLCRNIIKSHPLCHQAYHQLGIIAFNAGKMKMAAEFVGTAIKIDNTVGTYHLALGEIARRLGNLSVSIEYNRRAIKLLPDNAEAYYNIGLAFSDSNKFPEAARAYRKVIALNPNHNTAWNNLGTILEKLGDEEEALKAYGKAVAINPKNAEAQNNLGAIYSARGELEDAKKHFNASISANNAFVHAHFNLSTLKKYTPDDPHLKVLEAINQNVKVMSEDTKMRFAFAIAKAWEDVGKFDLSFQAYHLGNQLKRKTIQYDVNKTKENIDNIIKKFTKQFLKKKRDEGVKGCQDKTPIFIVGMPRSGTTLLEQVMSSHKEIFGAGELKHFPDSVMQMSKIATGVSYMDFLSTASDAEITKIGESYIKEIRKLNSNAVYICDKMPGNFFYVGLIHLALPNAKIIHSMRNPMDICFSNYSRLFNETMSFAYNLEELGHYYNSYERIMKHWHKVMPKGTILDISYEDMVEDLEASAKRITEYCGLDWDKSCLEFHKNERHVKTASVAQVRQPIYKTSVARWKNFEKHLEPLRTIIEGDK